MNSAVEFINGPVKACYQCGNQVPGFYLTGEWGMVAGIYCMRCRHVLCPGPAPESVRRSLCFGQSIVWIDDSAFQHIWPNWLGDAERTVSGIIKFPIASERARNFVDSAKFRGRLDGHRATSGS